MEKSKLEKLRKELELSKKQEDDLVFIADKTNSFLEKKIVDKLGHKQFIISKISILESLMEFTLEHSIKNGFFQAQGYYNMLDRLKETVDKALSKKKDAKDE